MTLKFDYKCNTNEILNTNLKFETDHMVSALDYMNLTSRKNEIKI